MAAAAAAAVPAPAAGGAAAPPGGLSRVMLVLSIIIGLALVALAVLFFYYGYSASSSYAACQRTESPYCYSLVCPSTGVTVTDDVCMGYAHRTDINGNVTCATSGTKIFVNKALT